MTDCRFEDCRVTIPGFPEWILPALFASFLFLPMVAHGIHVAALALHRIRRRRP